MILTALAVIGVMLAWHDGGRRPLEIISQPVAVPDLPSAPELAQ
jgi:hypothetical protein